MHDHLFPHELPAPYTNVINMTCLPSQPSNNSERGYDRPPFHEQIKKCGNNNVKFQFSKKAQQLFTVSTMTCTLVSGCCPLVAVVLSIMPPMGSFGAWFTLLCLVSMSKSFAFGVAPEGEILTFNKGVEKV
ncbi:hypothetical protein ZWY2020_021228 [Hordeum vulgare]|nr:hypothetical protein ZWY2020_021228 [Hordeum vulgare]